MDLLAIALDGLLGPGGAGDVEYRPEVVLDVFPEPTLLIEAPEIVLDLKPCE